MFCNTVLLFAYFLDDQFVECNIVNRFYCVLMCVYIQFLDKMEQIRKFAHTYQAQCVDLWLMSVFPCLKI